MPASFEQVMESCPLHPLSKNSKRAARRSILYYCDLKSLLALRLVSRAIGEWTSREESRYFHDIRITLNLAEESTLTRSSWGALERIGHLCQRVVFTLVATEEWRNKIEFENCHESVPTLNPLPNEKLFDEKGIFSLVELPVPILGGIFETFNVHEHEPHGLFKRVLDLTPNMQSLCIRDHAVWENTSRAEVDADWGRTLIDEALIYLRCQLEESIRSRFEELDLLKGFYQLEKESRIRELAELETLVELKQLTRLEEWLVIEFMDLSRLEPSVKSVKLAHIKEVARENRVSRLDRLFLLEESLTAQREEVIRLKKQTRLPKTLEMQLGSPLALWHFRTCLGYGNGGGPLPGAATWSTIKALHVTLPAVTPGLTPGRKRVVKKGVYNFLTEFAQTVETLCIGFAVTPGRKPHVAAEMENPLVYDLDPEFGGGGETAFYPALTRLVLKNMCIKWKGSLEEFFTTRAPNCVDVVLMGCGFESDKACRGFYKLFELQNPQRLRNPGVPLMLTRKLKLSGILDSGDRI